MEKTYNLSRWILEWPTPRQGIDLIPQRQNHSRLVLAWNQRQNNGHTHQLIDQVI